MYPDLFVLRNCEADYFAELDSVYSGWETMQCGVHRLTIVKRVGPLVVQSVPPVAAKRDAVWTPWGDLLLTDRAKRHIEGRLSGCTFRAAEFAPSFSGPKSILWEFVVDGFGGFARPKGGIAVCDACEQCGAYTYVVGDSLEALVDPDKWDHSDVFVIWPFPRIAICSAKAREACAGMRGVTPVPIGDFQFTGLRTATPGRPESWLSTKALSRLMTDQGFIEVVLDWQSQAQ